VTCCLNAAAAAAALLVLVIGDCHCCCFKYYVNVLGLYDVLIFFASNISNADETYCDITAEIYRRDIILTVVKDMYLYGRSFAIIIQKVISM
jgi:hypothetical protein